VGAARDHIDALDRLPAYRIVASTRRHRTQYNTGARTSDRSIVTDRAAPQSADEAENRYLDLALACDQAIIVCASSRIALVNDAAVGLLGATQPGQLVGRELAEFLPVETNPGEPGNAALHRYAPVQLKRLDDTSLDVAIARMRCRFNGQDGVQIVVRDAERHRSLQRQVQFLTRHDTLTEMPNRTEFRDRLIGAMARARRNGRLVAVMLVNLDRFSAVNAKFGHDAGDQVLQAVALRLQNSIRKSDSAARVGGDEFALILEGLEQREQAAVVANRVLANLKAPLDIAGFTGEITASAGVAASPADANELDPLLRMTDIAMYAAKEAGRGTFRFYFPELEAMSQRDQLRRRQTAELMSKLTDREREVMDVLVEGNSNKAIAYLLGASPRTIENHRARVMAKMQADSLPDLVRMVLDLKRG
jgi:diguanylate cyclase (GGDEF)-like protein